MLGLEVFVFCLLFGALADSQATKCASEWNQNIVADDLKSFCKVLIFCTCVLPAGNNDCPIDVYFTIDTSETIALQESPPGSLVESIKVPCLSSISWFWNLNRKFSVVISAKQMSAKINPALFAVSDCCRNSPESLFSVWTMRNTEVLCRSTGTLVDCTSPKSKECLVVLDPRVISLMWASFQSYFNDLKFINSQMSQLRNWEWWVDVYNDRLDL